MNGELGLPSSRASRLTRSRAALPRSLDGDFLPEGAAPEPRDETRHWDSFGTRFRFEFANLVYARMQTSVPNIDDILFIWAANNIAFHDGADPVFRNADEVYRAIDECSYSDVSWTNVQFRYDGAVDSRTAPRWKSQEYVLHTRDSLKLVENLAGSADFNDYWDYVPFEEYLGDDDRRYSHLMSARWAWKTAVRAQLQTPCLR
jgi:hypothetical protein